MYIIRSETFIEIDSLQHLKISRQTYPTNLSKICVSTFTILTLLKFFKNNAHYTYLHDYYILVWIYRIFWMQNIDDNTRTDHEMN